MKNTYATFKDPAMAEKAGGALLDHGIKAEHISIVLPDGYQSVKQNGKSLEQEHEEGIAQKGITTTTIPDAEAGAAKGAGIGLATGALAALAAIFVPGVGLVMGGGALALALGGVAGTTAAGAVAGGVTGFLKDQGVPADITESYAGIVRNGGALITVFPTDEQIEQTTIETILVKYNGVVSSYIPTGSAAVMVDNLAHADEGSHYNTQVTNR